MSRRKRERNRLSEDKVTVTGLGLSEVSVASVEESEERQTNDGLFQRAVSLVRTHWVASVIVVLALFTTTALALKYLDEDAKRQRAIGSQTSKDSSWLNSVNPFTSAPLPSPTPQLSKEYVYVGSRLLAVEDANANAAPPADLAVWRPSTGVWWVMGGQGSTPVAQGWGTNGDIPAQGDFDGDGKTDFSIYRPSTGTWWILRSSDGSYYTVQFGMSCTPPNGCDTLAQADYDGDGKTDVAVWRASDGTWYIISSSTGSAQYAQYGTNGDNPAPADYDGDGRADIAVWRDSQKTFYSINSSNSQSTGFNFTGFVTPSTSATPVSGDYDGDGKADYAVRQNANWIIRNSASQTSSTVQTVQWQLATDLSVQNDYDGDGKVDIATWRDSNGNWYIRQSASVGTANELRQVQWGMHEDTPVPAYYRR